MGLIAYRVRRRFQWNGWEFAPPDACKCERDSCRQCTQQVGSGCGVCKGSTCHCPCSIPAWRYGGDVWLVEERHPRLDVMMGNRFAVDDTALPPADKLLEEEKYSRLLSPPVEPVAVVVARKGR